MKMRKLLDYWIFYFTSALSILFAIGYVTGERIPVSLIQDTLGIPAWVFILAFTLSSVLNTVTNLHWKYHALFLSPFISYGILSMIAYIMTSNSWLTGLLAAHLYSGITMTFVLYISTRQERDTLRDETYQLLADIEQYKSDIEQLKSEMG
jgi:hypothetical protein